MPTLAACPDGPGGSFPGIIFHMDAPGMREELHIWRGRSPSTAISVCCSEHIPGELKQTIDKVDAKYELKVFPGTHHGFCFPERAVYDTLAAEETWSKIFAMWDRRVN